MRDTERGRDTGRGRSRLPVGILMQDSIPGSWPEPKASAQPLSHPGALHTILKNEMVLLNKINFISPTYKRSPEVGYLMLV